MDELAQRSVQLLERLTECDSVKRKTLIGEHILIEQKNDSISEFESGLQWFNTKDPLHLSKELTGKIVVLDFFTYCCINCMHILLDLEALERAHSVTDGVVVVGVHSAKFENEKVSANILSAILRYGIRHPVVNDHSARLWHELNIQCWPTLVILGPRAEPILVLAGEGHRDILLEFVGVSLEVYQKELSTHGLDLHDGQESLRDSPLLFPGKICTDESGSQLAVSDTGHHRVLVLDSAGIVQHVVGGCEPGYVDGGFCEARFKSPQGLCFYGPHSLIVADTENHRIRKVDLREATVSTLLGSGSQGHDYKGGKTGILQDISSPWDVQMGYTARCGDVGDVVFIAMAGTHQIWVLFLAATRWTDGRVHQPGTALRLAGSGNEENRNNSYQHKAGFAQPSGLALLRGKPPQAEQPVQPPPAKRPHPPIQGRPPPTQGPPSPTQGPPTQRPPPPTQGPPPPTQRPPPPTQGPPPPTHGPPPPTQGPPPPTQGPPPPTQGPPPPTQGPPPPTQGPPPPHLPPPHPPHLPPIRGPPPPSLGPSTQAAAPVWRQGDVLFVADSESSSVRAVDLVRGSVRPIVGANKDPMDLFAFGDEDGVGTGAKLQHPLGVAVRNTHSPQLLVADSYNHKIRTVDPVSGSCVTLLGGGGGEAGQSELLNEPGGLCVHPSGSPLYIADTNNHCIRVYDWQTTYKLPAILPESSVDSVDGMDNVDSEDEVDAAPRGREVVRTAGVSVGVGGQVQVEVELRLAPGLHLTDGAPSRWRLHVSDELKPYIPVPSSEKTEGRITEGDLTISFSLTAPVNRSHHTVDVTVHSVVYVCTDAGLCKMKNLEFCSDVTVNEAKVQSPARLLFCHEIN